MKKLLSAGLLLSGALILAACTAPLYGTVSNGAVASMSDGKYNTSGNYKRLSDKVDTAFFLGIPMDAKEVALSTTNRKLASECQGGRLENITTDVSITNFELVVILHYREEATCVMPGAKRS